MVEGYSLCNSANVMRMSRRNLPHVLPALHWIMLKNLEPIINPEMAE